MEKILCFKFSTECPDMIIQYESQLIRFGQGRLISTNKIEIYSDSVPELMFREYRSMIFIQGSSSTNKEDLLKLPHFKRLISLFNQINSIENIEFDEHILKK